MTRKIELGQFMLFAGIPAARALASRALSQETKASPPVAGAPPVSSGAMIERRSRGLDLNKAKPFNDRSSVLARIDLATGIKLAVPQMEKLGLLRTTSARSRTVFTGWYLPIQATWSSPAALSTWKSEIFV